MSRRRLRRGHRQSQRRALYCRRQRRHSERPAPGSPSPERSTLRAQELAFEFHLPIVYLVDSAGCTCPCRMRFSLTKSTLDGFSATMPRLSAREFPQLAAVMGSCVAGGAYLPDHER